MSDTITVLQQLEEIFALISSIFGGVEGTVSSVEGTVGSVESIFTSFAAIMQLFTGLGTAVAALFGFIGTAAVVLFFILVLIAIIILWFVLHIIKAIPVFVLCKRAGKKNAWLAFIPLPLSIVEDAIKLYLMATLTNTQELRFFNRYKVSNKTNAFWIWFGIGTVGCWLWNLLWFCISALSGGVALPTLLITWVIPCFAVGIFEYAFLRDVLNVYKSDKTTNNTVAVVATAIDQIIGCGLARTFCLYTIMKKDPIPEERVTEVEFEQA